MGFVLRLATRSRRQTRVIRERIATAQDPRSPGGVAILPCEMPDIFEAIDDQEALAAVVDINDGRGRATSSHQVEALNREYDAWLVRLPETSAA